VEPKPPAAYIRICRVIPPAAALTALPAGLVVLCGWFLDRRLWRGQLGDGAPMMPTSAVTFIVAAAALWLLRHEARGARVRWGGILAAAVVASGLLNQAQYLARTSLGLDRVIAIDQLAVAGNSYAWPSSCSGRRSSGSRPTSCAVSRRRSPSPSPASPCWS
jgi:hypothetical protein